MTSDHEAIQTYELTYAENVLCACVVHACKTKVWLLFYWKHLEYWQRQNWLPVGALSVNMVVEMSSYEVLHCKQVVPSLWMQRAGVMTSNYRWTGELCRRQCTAFATNMMTFHAPKAVCVLLIELQMSASKIVLQCWVNLGRFRML